MSRYKIRKKIDHDPYLIPYKNYHKNFLRGLNIKLQITKYQEENQENMTKKSRKKELIKIKTD